VKCTAPDDAADGVEMEALIGAPSFLLLTIYENV